MQQLHIIDNAYRISRIIGVRFILMLILTVAGAASAEVSLLNVSYDPTREFYRDYNVLFAKHWEEGHHEKVTVRQSHGGSGKQARAVIDGLDADVVTLALANDIDAISGVAGLIPEDWQKRLPDNSAPYTSTIVFLVRSENPKNIRDWDDLARDGVSVVTPDPKSSGGARWSYLAAWEFAMRKNNRDEAKAGEFLRRLYRNVPAFPSGSRGATTMFVQNEIGDVLLAWENEALQSIQEFGKEKLQIVVPSLSILAEPSVAWVDASVDEHQNRPAAEEYLKYLYSEEAQELAAKDFYRPRSKEAMEKFPGRFADVQLFTIEELGGWKVVQKKHFASGGIFDQVRRK
jgi:sulfate/thiosulfate transport system substrate-binding protein